MIDIVEEFRSELEEGQHLVVMPLTRVLIEDELCIGKYKFYPIGEVDIRSLRPVPNNSHMISNDLEIKEDDWLIFSFEGKTKRDAATAITGADPEVFKNNPLLVFTVGNLDWDGFLEADTHEYDKKILRNLTREAEKIMDIIKFYYCRADLVDTLPGTVGTWAGSNGFSSALLFNLEDYESYIIAGSVLTHTVVKGAGLELGINEIESIREECEEILNTSGEVGSIVKSALAMHTTFLETNNPTTKFIKAMTLLEFLANPDDYEKFEQVRKLITVHLAKDFTHYLKLKDRFNELTGKKDETGKHIGYRTRIIHIGEDIEDILGDDEIEVNKVMLEVQKYIGRVINDMLRNHQMTWQEFDELRKKKREALGIV